MKRLISIEKYHYAILKKDILQLKKEYPKIKIETIGKSTLKEEILLLKIGSGKKKLMINSAHHANEWITSLVMMLFLEKLLYYENEKILYKNDNIQEILKNITLYIIPMVNPDGVNFCLKNIKNEKYLQKWKKYENELDRWKANIRGVDLNLNYPAGWDIAVENKKKKGVNHVGPRDYPGPKPLSEIETINMVNFTNKEKLDMTISLHSQGEEIYGPNREEDIKSYQIGKEMERVSGYHYTSPPYTSSFAGYKDWFIQEFRKPSYTIEMGKGEEGKALSEKQAEPILQQMEEIFLKACEKI